MPSLWPKEWMDDGVIRTHLDTLRYLGTNTTNVCPSPDSIHSSYFFIKATRIGGGLVSTSYRSHRTNLPLRFHSTTFPESMFSQNVLQHIGSSTSSARPEQNFERSHFPRGINMHDRPRPERAWRSIPNLGKAKRSGNELTIRRAIAHS